MKRGRKAALTMLAATVTLLGIRSSRVDVPHVGGPLEHEAYVWQRDWDPAVAHSVSTFSDDFKRLVFLNAEIAWRDRAPRVTPVSIDLPVLRKCGRAVGLALRIGEFSGPFRRDDQTANRLADIAASMIAHARGQGVDVAELQIDFDCAESRLDGYRVWVETIVEHVSPTPVTFTALPAWLDRRAFRPLAEAADGYVLQVHSFVPPRSAEAPMTLCEPAAARRAVEQAGRIGVPFRVALPTYGYRAIFDANGRFLRVTAETATGASPGEFVDREVRADEVEMADLIRGWTKSRPAAMAGIIWYRLPVAGDALNWSWPTLAAVMAGRTPEAKIGVDVRTPSPELVEFDLVNQGNAAAAEPSVVSARWSGATMVACDGLAGFAIADEAFGGDSIEFRSAGGGGLKPGERRTIGWLRLDRESEVKVGPASN